MTQALEVVAGRRGWIISDGKTGNDVHTRGALGRLEFKIKRVAPTGIWQAPSRSGRVRPAVRLGARQSPLRAPWCRCIASGRLTVACARKLERGTGPATCTVILPNAKVPATTADLLGLPEPDTWPGPHVITTLTTPCGFTGARLRVPGELRANLQPRIAALPTHNVRAPGKRRRAPAPMGRGSPKVLASDPCERLESWSCEPLGSWHAIAASIAGRWVQRTPMLGERPPAPASEA